MASARNTYLRSRLTMLVVAVVMASQFPVYAVDTTWTLNGNGNWNVAGNWSSGEPNGNSFNAFIDDGDSAVTVTLNVNRVIGNLSIGSNDALRLSDTFDLSLTGPSLVNNGLISVIGGDVLNFNTDIILTNPVATFSGTGTIQLGGTFQSRILNTAVTNELINGSTHTIAGGGQLGVNSMKLTNQGMIDANISGTALIIDPSTSNAFNTGTMRATGGGILRFQGGVFTNTGGTIRAQGAGSVVELTGGGNGLSIVGGTLSTDANGLLQVTVGSPILQDVTIDGTLRVGNDLNLELRNTINNQSLIKLDGGGNFTDVMLDGEVQLTGGGEIQMIGLFSRFHDEFGAAEGHLINQDNYIHGRGQIGGDGGRMLLTNGGVIEADAGAVAGPLSIRGRSGAVGHPGVINTGILRASNNSTLNLSGTGGGAFKNEGTLESVGDGSVISTNNSAVITSLAGGVLTEGTYRVVSATGNVNFTTILFNAPNGVINTIGAAATVELSGDGSLTSFASGTQHIRQSLTTNNGTLKLFNGQNFMMTNALSNNGTVELGGIGLTGGILNSAGNITNGATGTIRGHGTINNTILNSGTVAASNGTLAIVGGIIDGQSGTIQVDAGATLNLAAASGGSDTDSLIHRGAGLALGANNILVRVDYVNDNSGVGNAYNVRANVTGAGQILASPGVTQSLGGDVTGGGTATATMAFGNVHVGDAPTRNYQINNSGPSGPSLRGAIQTSVGGANITDGRLTGAGVTASNFGPVAAGGNSGNLGVTFNATSAGALTGQQAGIVNNFDNVAEQTLQITGAAYRYANAVHSPEPVAFGNRHVGDTVLQTISVKNDVPADGFSESLNASFGTSTGGVSASGSFAGLGPGATNSTNMIVGINTSTAGNKSGTASLTLHSNGSGSSELGLTQLTSQTVNVTGNVYRLASPSAHSPEPANLGIVHVGDVVSSPLSISNAAANDGFSERLNASIGSATGDATAGGTITGLLPNTANSTNVRVGVNTATAGPKSGTATISLVSTGTGTSGLADTNLPSQTVNITAQVNNFAVASLTKASGDGSLVLNAANDFTLNLGFVAKGGTDLLASLSVSNSAAAPADTLAGSFTLAAPNFDLNGFSAFNDVAAGASQGGFNVGLDSAAAGDFTGTITLQPQSTNPQPFSMNLAPITIHLVGEVRLTGDYNDDGKVDAADYTVWRDKLGTASVLPNETVSIGTNDQQDYVAWKGNFGATAGSGSGAAANDLLPSSTAAVPEPGALLLILFGTLFAIPARPRSSPTMIQEPTL